MPKKTEPKPAAPSPSPAESAKPSETVTPVEKPSETEKPSAASKGGLKALAQAHASEKPTADSRTVEKSGPGRPAKSEEEKKATRDAYNAKRRSLTKPEQRKADEPVLSDGEKKSRIQAMATQMATTTIGIFSGLFGRQFADGATGNDDKGILESGWVSYFTAKEIYSMPPILALLLSHATYLLPRLDFRALWAKAFPKKEVKSNDQKPTPTPHAPFEKKDDILIWQPPVGEPVPSGAPGA